MKKGITPIIAIIILLLITMALAGAAWAFLSGYLSTMIGKSFMIPTQAAGCTAPDPILGSTITVYITNTGNVDIDVDDDVDMCLLDGIDCDGSLTTETISPGRMGKALSHEATGLAGDSHTIQIGMGASTGSVTVICPSA